MHAAGIILHGSIEKFFELGEGDDFVEIGNNFRLAHPQDGAVEEDILPPRQFRVKTGAHFQQTGHSRSHHHTSFGGFSDSRDDLQQSAFARAIAPENSDNVALGNIETYVFQRPEMLLSFFRTVVEAWG